MEFLREKTVNFSLRIIKLTHFLNKKNEYILSKQILRSATSIGANLAESKYAESKADLIHKYHISLKEANETDYWLELIYKAEYISEKQYKSLIKDHHEIRKILVTSLIKMKKLRNQKSYS
ncbi:four helix bundle protein [Flammeovirga yaeyamensis]|uniref:Four helix bundle protein n=1 Tax=Flammeovirga yaeyamensis TaxID=367791 RepID=A0AAX1MXU7_9BACT|nr:four helix bundle protein [Flammeovirga yaeyamensis]MBB3696353.1 four helix bundle protein [Flammeovirga yaeyamensis]NMF35032.1 four helix bundle protein [Flammeovirga yaeyamensis]QWG00144.1 four helix bundle protein [Flammeovirga yaeyamensis]